MKNFRTSVAILLLFSFSISSYCQSSQESGKKPYVVIKFDDLTNKNWKDWKPVTDIILEKDVKADLGIFVQSLNSGDKEYMNYVRSLISDPKHFDIWLHGYTGEAKEFFDTDYAFQLDHFYKSRTLMLQKFDFILRNYGGHYYGGNAHTIRIINEDPFLKGYVFNSKFTIDNQTLLPEKRVMSRRKVNMEPKTAVVSYAHFHNAWLKNNADTFRYVVLQGHGWGYKSDTLKNEFKKVVDELKSKQVIFTHFREYDRMVKGYYKDQTPPSAPAQLKAVRSGNNVQLSWNASNDPESGIDCYKIYRDGVCIDLSATPNYEDQASGKHKYQVSAVNNNDLVSVRSSSVKLKK